VGKEVSKKMPTVSLWLRFEQAIGVFISSDWEGRKQTKKLPCVFTALPSSLLKFRTVFKE